MSSSDDQVPEHPHVEEFVHSTRSNITELQNQVAILQARVDSLERVLTAVLLNSSHGLLEKSESATANDAAAPNKPSARNNASHSVTPSPPQQQLLQHQPLGSLNSQSSAEISSTSGSTLSSGNLRAPSLFVPPTSPALPTQSTHPQPQHASGAAVAQAYALRSPTTTDINALPLMPFVTGSTPTTVTANPMPHNQVDYEMERFGLTGPPFVQSVLPPMNPSAQKHQQQQQQQQQHPLPSFNPAAMMNNYMMQQQRDDAVMAMLNGQSTPTETPTGYGPIFPPNSAAAVPCVGPAGGSSSIMDGTNGLHMPPFPAMMPGNFPPSGYPMLNSTIGNGIQFFDMNVNRVGGAAGAGGPVGMNGQPHGMAPFNGIIPAQAGLAPAVLTSPSTANAVANFLTRNGPSNSAGGAGSNGGSGTPYTSSLDPARTTNETLDRVCQQNPWLKEVCLRGCKNVTNFIPLTRLRNLWKLNLQGCVQYVDDDLVRLIATYTRRLSRLNLCGCERITDATPLAQLSFLFDLNLSGCKIGDASLEAISRGCLQLSRLAINSCPNITNISCISNLKELKLLYCRYSGNITPASIAHVMNSIANSLLTVNVDGVRFTELNLSGMAGAPAALKNFNTKDNTEIINLRWLTSIPQMTEVFASLEMFDVEGCTQLCDINGLELLPSLKILRLSHTAITQETLLKLTTSSSITTLHLDGCNNISNVECLLKLPRLTKVVLSQSMSLENPATNGIAALRQSERVEVVFAIPQTNNSNNTSGINNNNNAVTSAANSSAAKSDATTQGASSPAEAFLLDESGKTQKV